MLLTKNSLFKKVSSIFLSLALSIAATGCGKRDLIIAPDTGVENKNLQAEKKNAVPGQLVVRFKQTMNEGAMAAFAEEIHAAPVKISTRMNTAVFQFSAQEDLTTRINSLNENQAVDYAEPHYLYGVKYTVSDPKSIEQHGLALANLAKAWDITFGDPKIIIAVVDTGVDLNHPDLKNKIVPGYNVISNGSTPPMDDNGHGTHVAGIAAASTNNKIGIAGTAPNCKVMPIKVLNARGGGVGAEGGIFNVAVGIIWAVDHGARVINLSLGGPDGKTLRRAIDYALKKNVVVVGAMGNDGKSIKAYPAALPGVISVGSVDIDKSKSDFSNYGDWISVAAPGREIMSTLPTYNVTMNQPGFDEKSKNYDALDGTSMATPIVAGVAALVLSRNPNYSPAEVKERIESTATDIGNKGYDKEFGHGLINAAKAVL